MSKREAILIVSRAVSFYLLCWAFADLTYVPARVHSVLHYLGLQTVAGGYLRDSYVLEVVFLFLRIAVFSIAAIWFYKGGPRIYEFFLPEAEAGMEE